MIVSVSIPPLLPLNRACREVMPQLQRAVPVGTAQLLDASAGHMIPSESPTAEPLVYLEDCRSDSWPQAVSAGEAGEDEAELTDENR